MFKEMTIKKRLLISNILMIAVPVIVSLLVGLACLEAVRFSLENNIKPGLDTAEDFPESCRKLELVVEHVLQESPRSWKKKFHIFDDVFLDDNISYRITNKDAVITEGGTFPDEAQKLSGAMTTLGNNGLVSDGTHSLYAHTISNVNGTYLLELYGVESTTSYHTFKTLLIICIALLSLTVIISVWLTDRFLISFVFKRIEEPLDILSKGVSELRDGNLSYRISYKRHDEFTPVCDGFNDMASHLKDSIESVKEHEANRTELIAGISHDLRTPITAILAYVEGLLDGIANTPDKQQKYLVTIKDKAQELEHLISQLFLFSKMELADFPIHAESCAIGETMHHIVESCRAEYGENSCVISESYFNSTVPADITDDVFVTIDRDLLSRVCMNIIGNSVKYKRNDVVHVAVAVEKEQSVLQDKENDSSQTDDHVTHDENTTASTKQQVSISMSDDGPGVPTESLAHLFTVFYRCDGARKNTAEGSGLGLAIAAKAVQKMGGTIRAENIATGGLSVIITLPQASQLSAPQHDKDSV